MDKAAELLGDDPERKVEREVSSRRLEKARTGTPARPDWGRKPDDTCAFCIAEGFPGGHPPK